jgi:hypothetical protein
MFRSMNSALDLKRGEYDFEVVYAATDPLIAEDIRGWVDVNRERIGSGCDLDSGDAVLCCEDLGDAPKSNEQVLASP